MDFKQIQELIKIINKSNIGELSIEENDFKITIKQKKEKTQTIVSAPPAPVYAPPPIPVAPQQISQPATTDTAPTPAAQKTENLI